MCRTSADAKYNMHNRLEAAGRLVIRTCIALFTGVVIALLQSAFWTEAVSGSMRAIVVGMALLAYFRPHYGLLALAVLTPLGQVGSRTLDSNMRGAEALVLAFLAGALLRGWTLHRFRSLPSHTLLFAAMVFSAVVAASCIEQVWVLRLRQDFPATFFLDAFEYATRRYLIVFDGFNMIFSAMLLLEGIALLICVACCRRARADFAYQLIVSLVIGAVAAAAVNFTYVGFHLAANGLSLDTMRGILTRRWSFHVGDVNAAASFFAMAMFIAIGAAWRRATPRGVWIAAAVLIGGAFWLTGSRTALVAVLVPAMVLVARFSAGRSMSMPAAAALTAVALGAGGALVAQLFPTALVGAAASQAVRIRWLFLGTTWRMLRDEPLFGLGVGQYARWSSHYSVPELSKYYAQENAHNYFAQVAGELGLIGLITFVWVLAAALWMRKRRPDAARHPFIGLVAAGLAVFILTWLGGHPLLVPEVSYPFWLALGIVPAMSSEKASRATIAVTLAIVAALALSIPLRVENKGARGRSRQLGHNPGLMPKRSLTKTPFPVPEAPILVVGDIMCDHYVWGDVERISPEAPVQILRWQREADRPGGAANAAMNLAALGCRVHLVGVVGRDEPGRWLVRTLRAGGIDTRGVVNTSDRPTTLKTRVIARGQHILRIDRETRAAVSPRDERRMVAAIRKLSGKIAGVVCSDYSKGALSDRVLAASLGGRRRPFSVVDPKGRDFSRYRGAHLLTPNEKELMEAVGDSDPRADGEEVVTRRAESLMRRMKFPALLVTRGASGMDLFETDKRTIRRTHIPALQRHEVFDVTGAGDTVAAVLAMAASTGMPLAHAARIANAAAGIVVGMVGTAIPDSETLARVIDGEATQAGAKVLPRRALAVRLVEARAHGATVVFTSGTFETLNVKDLRRLQRARAQGDLLVVGVNEDSPEASQRAEMLAALRFVDYVTLFSERTPARVIRELQPDVIT